MLRFFAVQNHKKITGFTSKAMDALKSHSWKGNVRELRNTVERIAILARCEEIGPENLPSGIVCSERPLRIGDSVTLDRIEEEHIKSVVNSAPSLRDAADILGIDQATLWRKRKKYGI